LVGCGGTGSHLASGLASIAQTLGDGGQTCSMVFIDPDRVEQKNVGRQLFSQADIGQPKAEVLSNRLNAALGMTIGASIRAIDSSDTFIYPSEQALNIVVGAVDTAAARAIIAQAVKSADGRLWWVDVGNENHSGQVCLGNVCNAKRIKPALGLVDCLPAPSLLFPDLVATLKSKKEKRKPGRAPSCAELAASGEQSLMVNRVAAAWAASMLHDFLVGQLQYFAVAFDLNLGGVKSWVLEEETLRGLP